mmetsp:Transcript_9610/g.20679  ORF Transcript_9610/g.20679 Transcript_9610/m.20679 type:complete len:408 (-) Transcript_9610:117-1340(-)
MPIATLTPAYLTASFFTCSLCCEDKEESTRCTLSKCSHESCTECMTKWVEKEEASGRLTPPKCPFCRIEMDGEDVVAIMGRPFQPRDASADPNVIDEGELDELTMHWLNEQTQPCPSCGARIEKLEGGCDMMECLCGYRFCYGCGSQGATCSCTPSNHYFWDNVLDRQAEREAGPVASVNEEDNQVDLFAHISERKRREDAKQKREARADMRREKASEQMNIDEFTSSAKWLFCSEKAQEQMLRQYWRTKTVQRTRIHAKMRRENEELARREIGDGIGEIIIRGSWLFKDANASDTIARLQRMLQYEDRSETKCRRRTGEGWDKLQGISLVIAYGSWLYKDSDCNRTLLTLSKMIETEKRMQSGLSRRRMEKLFSGFTCQRPDCTNCGSLTEEENAIAIKSLFLNEE